MREYQAIARRIIRGRRQENDRSCQAAASQKTRLSLRAPIAGDIQLARSIEMVFDEIPFVLGFAVFVMAGTERGHMRVNHDAPGAI